MKNKIQEYINNGLITSREHLIHKNLSILNYTPEAQFKRNWDEITLSCRGLVYDNSNKRVVALPFQKFFNFEELVNSESLEIKIPRTNNFHVYEKYDGSLGILFNYNGEWILSTRGSFESNQAIKGTQILKERYSEPLNGLNKENTYLFEIIYPNNRIVVNYGNDEKLVLLGCINTATKQELPIDNINWPDKAKRYEFDNNNVFELYKTLKSLDENNREGYVFHFPESNFRFKVKFENYFLIHKVMFQMTNKTIWKAIKDHGFNDVTTILKDIPDEFYPVVEGCINSFKEERDEIFNKCLNSYKRILWEFTEQDDFDMEEDYSKAFALRVKESVPQKFHSILFAFHRNRDYEKLLIEMIKPDEVKNLW